jgi:glutamate-1-semialdehyde 2,1-aminomutase
MAHEHGLAIMLHIVRDDALADPDNLRELRQCCLKYPNAHLILAHAARGFHAPNTLNGIAGLRGLENVWFDTSGICEPAAFEAILHEFGPRRLLWGTDHPVSEIRGRCVTVGEGFAWLDSDSVRWDKLAPDVQPTLVGLESLRALQMALDTLCLNDADRRDIYADNARRLLGLKIESGTQTQDLYRRAKELIPGGTQLLSKRPEMQAPNQWPAYFREARGCETWDLDGKHYYDFSTNGIGSCLLGFRDPDVTRAVQRRIELGSMCTLNAPEEVELAELLCAMHPWAEQARFARCGGEACAMAVRIARATTDRSVVAICGYHGWQDWYLAANLGESDTLRGHLLPGLNPQGVPRELRGTAATFPFNDRDAFQALLHQHGTKLAAVIMETCRSQEPDPGFLEYVREGAHRVGALLIMDEISIGLRLHCGGAHLKFGIEPDMAVFAKALGNGHPMAAVIGTRQAMAGAQNSFISSTYWTEGVGPVAALATLQKMQAVDVPSHIARVGSRVQSQWEDSARLRGLPVQVGGFPCLASFRFDHPQADALRTLYTQMMLSRGYLAGSGLYPTLAHTDVIVDRYSEAIDSVFKEIAEVLASDDELSAHLRGPVAHSGFRRLAG